MRGSKAFLSVLATLALVLSGCSSTGRTTEPDTDSVGQLTALLELGESEIEVPSLPKGCVETIEELELPYHVRADDERLLADRLIVVRKEARRVMLFSNGLLRHDRPDNAPDCWRIGLGPQPVFDKLVEGDGRTPEGLFRTSDKPWSNYYGAMLIHYPSSRHARQAHNAGRVKKSAVDEVSRAELAGTAPPQTTPLGGDILIHGGGSSSDWTLGCIALSTHDLDELRGLLPKGMKTWILILP